MAGVCYRGTLEINPLNAELVHDHDSFGDQDPYVSIYIGKQKKNTEVDKNGGLKPKWHRILEFSIDNDKEAYIKVKDSDFFGHDMIGEANINLIGWYESQSGCVWQQLH